MVYLQFLFLVLTSLLYHGSVQAQYSHSKLIISGANAAPKLIPNQVFVDQRLSDSIDSLKIYFGAVDITNIYETGQQRLIVKRKNIIVHSEYDPHKLLNDIALIRLPAEILFDEYIQPAKLPDPDKLYDNEIGVVSGWGIFDRNSWSTPNNLQWFNVTIFPYEECKRLVHKYEGFHASFYPTSNICLKPSQGLTCNGDSGGPLAIRNEDGTTTIVGLTSFGLEDTCEPNMPDIFTRVSSFLQWIKENE
ncbi:chymotrypsin-2-like [Drosophila albomicans]|uniref:Chymotrypsin-2-like n=1 Tax=Drosophila albomicans TaxID=7291 RepID=A0A6P8WT53_DROAB|nr:chymotrypsin-2-like [Drosophila albomicans]